MNKYFIYMFFWVFYKWTRFYYFNDSEYIKNMVIISQVSIINNKKYWKDEIIKIKD
jgi:hypothetical protein